MTIMLLLAILPLLAHAGCTPLAGLVALALLLADTLVHDLSILVL